eukprot:1684408-Ditylum_brightwellii.AAC.1
MEKVSPHKATQQFISTYVMGYDDNYKGEDGGRNKSTLVKHLTTECFGSMKDIPNFMIGMNPTEKHCQAVLIDAENNKIYSHCSLRHVASNVDKVIKGLQTAGILNDLSVDKYKTVKALHQHN